MNRGYIKIWRKIEDSGILHMPNTLALFMFLLLNASHQERKVGTPLGIVNLLPGQYISGRIKLASDLKQSEREIRTSLSRLLELGIIDQQTTSKYSIYTIVNYSNYQGCDQQTTSTSTSKRPADDQQTTTKQELQSLEELNKTSSSSSDDILYSTSFIEFWNKYPLRKSKGAAWKAWKKIKPSEVQYVMIGLESAKKSKAWLKDNGAYIKHPASWLNARGWEDEDENVIVTNQQTITKTPEQLEQESLDRVKARTELMRKRNAEMPLPVNPWE